MAIYTHTIKKTRNKYKYHIFTQNIQYNTQWDIIVETEK